MRRRKTNEEYDLQLLESELDFLRLEDYVTNKTPILHEHICGFTWKVRPAHILSGHGCPKCAGNISSADLSSVELLESYVNHSMPILVRNKTCGHKYRSSPDSIKKNKCPICSLSGFKANKPAIVYHIKIGDYYKIGITNRTVRERFAADADKLIKVLWIKKFALGSEAREFERAILNSGLDRVRIPGYLKSGGNTELFTQPIVI